MGLLSFLKTSPGPYKDNATNLIYNLLFCDDVDLFKTNTKQPYTYPFDILYAPASSALDLQQIIDDKKSDARLKLLACNRQISKGYKPPDRELLGIILEVRLDNTPDVLGVYADGSGRYIDVYGKMITWEPANTMAKRISEELFLNGREILKEKGALNTGRRSAPNKGRTRITLLVSDGLYFKEGPIESIFNDPLLSPAIRRATELMRYVAEKTEETESG